MASDMREIFWFKFWQASEGWTCNVLVSRIRLLCLTVWIEYINDF